MSLEEQLDDSKVVTLLESYFNSRITPDNNAQLLINGGEAFQKKIALIKAARNTIYLQNMILMDDPTGLRLIYEMLEAVKRGVVVRIMLDATASWSGHKNFINDLDSTIRSNYKKMQVVYPNFKNELETTHRSITIYKAPKKSKALFPVIQHDEMREELIISRLEKYSFSEFGDVLNPHTYLGVMHDKVLVIDNQYGITGGMNIADNYSHTGLNSSKIYYFSEEEVKSLKEIFPQYWKKIIKQWGKNLDKNHYDEKKGWRDTGIFVKGSVASQMQDSFLKHWNRALVYYPKKDARSKMSKVFSLKQSKFNPKSSQDFALNYVKDNQEINSVKAMTIAQIPLEGEIYYTRFIKWAIESARSEIVCQTPYAVYSKWMKEWLLDAADRGVKVTLFTNSVVSNDVGSSITWLARRNYVELMQNNDSIRVFEWQKPTLHSKLCVVDGYLTLIGSNNNDIVGAYNSSEFGVAVFDKRLAGITQKVLAEDAKHSKEVGADDLKQWSQSRYFSNSKFIFAADKDWILFKLLKDQVYGKLEKQIDTYLFEGIYSH